MPNAGSVLRIAWAKDPRRRIAENSLEPWRTGERRRSGREVVYSGSRIRVPRRSCKGAWTARRNPSGDSVHRPCDIAGRGGVTLSPDTAAPDGCGAQNGRGGDTDARMFTGCRGGGRCLAGWPARNGVTSMRPKTTANPPCRNDAPSALAGWSRRPHSLVMFNGTKGGDPMSSDCLKPVGSLYLTGSLEQPLSNA